MNDDQMWKVAHCMSEAADKASRAADRMEEAMRRLACMLEDGYGGNALRLIELLEAAPTRDLVLAEVKSRIDEKVRLGEASVCEASAGLNVIQEMMEMSK